MTDLDARIAAVKRRISAAAAACGRDVDGITLLAVTKSVPAASLTAAQRAGVHDFGGNYLQEAVTQMDAVPGATWHFIGRVQSNKTREIASRFAWVHTVDRLRVAERLSSQRPPSAPPLNVCIQVDIDGEATKAGVASGDAAALAAGIARLPNLRLRGLMAIPRPHEDDRGKLDACMRVRALYDRLRDDGFDLDTLSLGMSADLEQAIAAGATMVRIGTALFGPRT